MILALAAAAATLASVLGSAPGITHNPEVAGVTVCRPSEDSPWTVTWTVNSDVVLPNLTWRIRTPGGDDDTQPTEQRGSDETFSRAQEYPASQESATETVLVDYYLDGEFDKSSTREATIDRPPVCEQAAPTTTAAPTSTTTTTAEPTTTTSTPPLDAPTTTVDVDSGGPTTTVGSVTTQPPASNLPNAGSNSAGMATIAVVVLLGGVALVTVSRGEPTR